MQKKNNVPSKRHLVHDKDVNSSLSGKNFRQKRFTFIPLLY